VSAAQTSVVEEPCEWLFSGIAIFRGAAIV
jgi:hypothetical protein